MRRAPAAHDFNGWVAQLGVSSCRRRAKLHLLAAGPPALPALRRGLLHQNAIVRRQCVGILDHLADEASLVSLVSALDDADASVSARALHSLACDRCKENDCRPGEDLWVPRALELLHDRNPDRRAAAIDALGKVARRRPDAAAALAAAAEADSDRGLRGMARRRTPTSLVGAPSEPRADVRRQQRDLVRRGYDAISERYRDDHGAPNPATAEAVKPYGAWLDELAGLLPAGARVLDLGCGSGLPASRMLVERGFAVTGVDISRVQVDRARRLVPQARFVQADMAEWGAAPASFDAIVSLYALIHVPIGDQLQLFPRLAAWLVPGGYLLAIVGTERWSGVEDYMGAPMFWDHADAGTYLDWFAGASLHPVWHRAVPEGSSSHTLVLARTPAAT